MLMGDYSFTTIITIIYKTCVINGKVHFDLIFKATDFVFLVHFQGKLQQRGGNLRLK